MMNLIKIKKANAIKSDQIREKGRNPHSLFSFFFALLISVLLLLIPVGCKKKEKTVKKTSDGKTILTFWHTMNREETETLLPMVEQFEKENPDIKIEMQAVPFDQAQNKFKIVAQAGDAPDIFRSEIAWTPEEAALGYLTCLDDYVSEEDKQDYLPACLSYNIYQGHIYGIPQVTDCLALLYNKEMFEKAGVSVPETMDEFVEAGQKLTIDENGKNASEPGFNPDKVKQYAFYFVGKAYFFQPFLWSFGGGLLDPDKKEILINNEGSVKGLEFLISLKDKYHITPSKFDLQSSYDNMMAGFKGGQYAMIMNGPWATADILKGEAFKNPDNLGVAVIPKGPAGYGSPVGGHNYVISRNCADAEKAWKFINYMNRPENQAKLALNNNLLPTRKSTYEIPEVQQNYFIANFYQQLKVSNNRPVVPQGGLLYTSFDPYFQAAYLGAMPPQDALNEVALNWKKLMAW